MKLRLAIVAFCFASLLFWGDVLIALAQSENRDGDSMGLYGSTLTSDTYIAGELLTWSYPVANFHTDDVSDLHLIIDLPPQFNLVQVRSGWFSTEDEWSRATDVTLRYQTSEDNPDGPWRDWVDWGDVTHRRWGLAFVSDLDLPPEALVSRIRYDFGTVPTGWQWGQGRNGLPQIEGFVTPYGWNGRPVFEGEEIAGCSTLVGETASGEVLRQTDCQSSLRVSPVADMSLFQYSVDQVEDDAVYQDGDVVDIEIGLRHQSDSTADLLDPVLASVLPKGMNYVPNSWYFVDGEQAEITTTLAISDTEAFVPLFTPPRPLFTTTEGRNGETLLIWTWRDVSALSLPYEFGGNNPAVRIRFQVTISDVTSTELLLGAQLVSESPDMTCWGEDSRIRDTDDIDDDGRLGEPVCFWSTPLAVAYTPIMTETLFQDGLDLSDAPASYGQASHVVSSTVRLGLLTDVDQGELAAPFANGDDRDGRDDEEGLIWGNDGVGVPGKEDNKLTVVSLNRSRETRYLHGWLDINGDGRFDETAEQILTGYPVPPRTNPQAEVITFGLPETAFCGVVMARFRFGDEQLIPTGESGLGEVEDIPYTIQCQSNLELQVEPVYPVIGKGEVMRWNLTITNTGPSLAHQVVVSNTILDGLAYAGHAVNPVVGWRCNRIGEIEELRKVSCTLPELVAGRAVTMQVAVRVPVLFDGDAVPNIAQVQSLTLERDMSRNFIQSQVSIDKSWQAIPFKSSDLFFFTHARFNEAFVVQDQFREQDLYAHEYVVTPIQLPVEIGLGINGQRPPYLTVPSCVLHPNDATCNANNLIEGTFFMDGYRINEIYFEGESVFKFEKPVWEEAPDLAYVRMSRIVDSRMTRCAGRGSCIGFDLFRLDANGRAPYGWSSPHDYFYLNFVTKGGRDVTCPDVYEGRCAIVEGAKPGIYEVHGEIHTVMNFQDVRLGGEPVTLNVMPIEVVTLIKVVAPFIEPEQ